MHTFLFKKITLLTTPLKIILVKVWSYKSYTDLFTGVRWYIFYSSVALRQEESDLDHKVMPVVISDLTVQEISYPNQVVVPVVISDLDLVRGAEFYK